MELMPGKHFSLCKVFKLNCLATLSKTEASSSAMNPPNPSAWKNSSPNFGHLPMDRRIEFNQRHSDASPASSDA